MEEKKICMVDLFERMEGCENSHILPFFKSWYDDLMHNLNFDIVDNCYKKLYPVVYSAYLFGIIDAFEMADLDNELTALYESRFGLFGYGNFTP